METLRIFFRWLSDHKRVVFIYFPLLFIAATMIYALTVYFEWEQNRKKAFEKLEKYKKLIDHTEELKEGLVYSYRDVDVSAKVVDIPTRIYDRNNEIIGEFFEEKREIVPYDYIPSSLVKAVIASEDRNFYHHNGISVPGIARAMIVNIINLKVVQGGSTITQQLAKVLFTDMERNLKRKIYETFCALDIEKKYDKQDIISMYLNVIYFGSGAYGVESTSKMFFGKSVKELNEVEAAMIVATISNPKMYSPLLNINNSIRKTRRILQSLVDAGFIKERKAELLYKKFLKKWDVVYDNNSFVVSSLIGSFMFSTYRVNRAPFFIEHIRRILVDKFGEDALKKGGLSVYTTIDGLKQDVAVQSLKDGIAAQREYHAKKAQELNDEEQSLLENEKREDIQGALVSLDPATGEIIAYEGGSDFSMSNQYDHVSQILRQPGSSFKPIIYCAAIENKDITPSTLLVDEKTTFEGKYTPSNYENSYAGEVIVREALKRSLNVIAVKVLDKTGYTTIFHYIQNSLDLSDNDMSRRFGKTLSLALGAYEVSPIENATLHSLIVNGGNFIRPYGIKYVKDYNGTVVWNNEDDLLKEVDEKRKSLKKIIDPRAAAVAISILRGVFEKGGTAYWAVKQKKPDYQIAGKTGTSSNYIDAWFVGYTSNLVTAVWIGNRKGGVSLGKGRSGSSLAVPVWLGYTEKIFKESPPPDFTIPDEGISRETICLQSGEVAGRNGECPDTAEQVYYSGTEPGVYCHIHVKKDTPQEEKDE